MRKDYLQALANLASSRALPSDQVVFSSAVSNELSWNHFTAPTDGIFLRRRTTVQHRHPQQDDSDLVHLLG